MNKEQCIEIKKAIREILEDFEIKTEDDFMLEAWDSGLYEALKAGVMEEYALNDDQMGKLLDEVLRE